MVALGTFSGYNWHYSPMRGMPTVQFYTCFDSMRPNYDTFLWSANADFAHQTSDSPYQYLSPQRLDARSPRAFSIAYSQG